MSRRYTYIIEDQRTLRACSNVYNSDYILEQIFINLDLEEQVKIANICKRFKRIITKFVWPKTAYHLNLYKTPYVNILTTSTASSANKAQTEMEEVNATKVAFNHRQCNDFLFLNAKNVEILKINSEFHDYQQEMGVSFRNVEVFRNLTFLSYFRMVLTNDQLELVARKCLKLQKLHLLECYCDDLRAIVPGEQLDLDIILGMNNLDELVIHNQPSEEITLLNSYYLQKMLKKSNLKCLILKNFTIDDDDVDTAERLSTNLEILNIGLISMSFWASFMHYLNHFQNLQELTITVADCNTTINVQLIDILATKCKNLHSLSLENCDTSVDDFSVLQQLRHLSLISCGGLTFANFQQILGGLRLKTLNLVNTPIYGIINHVYVSPTLEEITIDTIRFTQMSDAFQKSLNKFENLHTLKWLNGDINDNWIIDKCPKLTYLHIPNPYLLRRIVFTMKSLEELTFASCTGLSWCFIMLLIKNLSLKRLYFQTHDVINDGKEIPQNACNTVTTLERMMIPCDIFKMAQPFWIDLLSLNENLQILIYGKHEDLLDGIFLNELLENSAFRERVQTIKICGFILDCFELYTDFNAKMHRLNKHTSHYRSRNIDFTMEM